MGCERARSVSWGARLAHRGEDTQGPAEESNGAIQAAKEGQGIVPAALVEEWLETGWLASRLLHDFDQAFGLAHRHGAVRGAVVDLHLGQPVHEVHRRASKQLQPDFLDGELCPFERLDE